MRIITGTARGKKLVTVPGTDIVRPTPERVKEAVFSAIQFDIEGRRILDLFAGSGQLGLEALSRGAASATFVDASDVSLGVVRENLEKTGFTAQSRVVRSDFTSFLATCTDRFDIAFLDPPYRSGYLEKAALLAAPMMSHYGIIICEHPLDVSLPEQLGDFDNRRCYRYGKVAVTVFRKGGDEK